MLPADSPEGSQAGCRVLGTTSADGSSASHIGHWQCDALESQSNGIVVIFMAPSVDFEAVYSHNSGQIEDGEKTHRQQTGGLSAVRRCRVLCAMLSAMMAAHVC